MHSKSHLLDVRGFSDAKVDKLLDACRKALSNPSERGGFVTHDDVPRDAERHRKNHDRVESRG